MTEQAEKRRILDAAIDEIYALRRRNEVLAAKVDGFEMAVSLLNAMPRSAGQGYAPDIVHDLTKLALQFSSKDTPE